MNTDYRLTYVEAVASQPKPRAVADDDSIHMRCPLCGDENTHIHGHLAFNKGNDDYASHPKVRGDVLAIPGCCESGCMFTIFFGQHKGYTFMWAEHRMVPVDRDWSKGGYMMMPSDEADAINEAKEEREFLLEQVKRLEKENAALAAPRPEPEQSV